MEADAQGLAIWVEYCDVSQPERVEGVVAKTVVQFGGLDLVAIPLPFIPLGR
jgi:NAD(P)-dependent dehydrogenase (short-subunit alcohol dehydrogenase family)